MPVTGKKGGSAPAPQQQLSALAMSGVSVGTSAMALADAQKQTREVEDAQCVGEWVDMQQTKQQYVRVGEAGLMDSLTGAELSD
ncbi:hypothetical protein B484DRAFT_410505 [Ochromonadaceae sp. CCMP2298]|nr:hypothetical protein B484DRAFT_410505 [Ochromonadaceae sp. CCMP2298]